MLLGHHYQNAYICDDLDEGIAQFRGRGLLKEPYVIEVDQPVKEVHGVLSALAPAMTLTAGLSVIVGLAEVACP